MISLKMTNKKSGHAFWIDDPEDAGDLEIKLQSAIDKHADGTGEKKARTRGFTCEAATGDEDYEIELIALSDFKKKIGAENGDDICVPDADALCALVAFLACARDEEGASAKLFALLTLVNYSDVDAAIQKVRDVELSTQSIAKRAEEYCNDVFDMKSVPEVIRDNVDWEAVGGSLQFTTFEFCATDYILCNGDSL